MKKNLLESIFHLRFPIPTHLIMTFSLELTIKGEKKTQFHNLFSSILLIFQKRDTCHDYINFSQISLYIH